MLVTRRIELMQAKLNTDDLMLYPRRAEFVSGDNLDQIKLSEKI